MVSSTVISQSQFNISNFLAHSLLFILFLTELDLICLTTSNAIVSKQLNGFNDCYLTLIILFNINHLFARSEVVASSAI